MAYTFFKALGGEIGDSLCENERLGTCKEIVERAEKMGVKIHLPIDSKIANKFASDAETRNQKSAAIPEGWMGLDIGTETIKSFTKVLIVENLLKIADNIIIGGGMAYTFFKALGGEIGDSLCENERLGTCKEIVERAEKMGVKIHLPTDSKIANKFASDAETRNQKSDDIPEGWMGLDIGTETIKSFTKVLMNSKTILWNGPMGVFEMDAFAHGTKSIAEAVAEATKNGAYSLIGGGDSAAAVQKFGFSSQVSYVSTGGGALLEYFEGKELPGISAIVN